VEIPFRGTGWVYLGELGSRRGIAYDSRRLDPDGQTFIFRAETAGTYALKFYKQDFIRDYILNDYVKVIVGEAPESSGAGWFNPPVDRGRVTAEPRWPPAEHPSEPPPAAPLPETAAPPADDAIQPAPSAGTAVFPEASAQTPLSPPSRPVVTDDGIVPVVPPSVPQETTTPAIEGVRGSGMPEDAEPDEYVRRAKEEYDAGRVGPALAVLDRLKLRYPSLTDEALLLYGQLLESNSPSRDIRLALEYYRRLVREYPQSPLVPQAQRRIAYLERYYFTIQ
jgi:tetratricopeptide (TPR) repeat protein